MKVRLIQVWQQKAVTAKSTLISRYCKLIDLQPPSYYRINLRQARLSSVNNTQIALKMAFTASGQNYGSSRLLQLLHNQNNVAGC